MRITIIKNYNWHLYPQTPKDPISISFQDLGRFGYNHPVNLQVVQTMFGLENFETCSAVFEYRTAE